MMRTFPELSEWSFDINEMSAGVYQVVASDRRGHRISKTGIAPDVLIDECRREANATIQRASKTNETGSASD
jgi:hypothetical protein